MIPMIVLIVIGVSAGFLSLMFLRRDEDGKRNIVMAVFFAIQAAALFALAIYFYVNGGLK